VIGDSLTKLDINRERISFGASAGMFRATNEFTPEDLARLNRTLDATYADFTGKAAQGRGKTVEEIEKVARGRVWSGTDALKVGLVDEIGGFLKALDYTKTKIGLQPTDRVRLVEIASSEESWWDFFKLFDDSNGLDDVESFFQTAAWFTKTFSPLMGKIEARTDGTQLYLEPVGTK
jgi:ClpP class serine protease